MNKKILKNIGAVIAGFLVVVILSTLTDTLLEAAGIFPPISNGGLFVTWMLALAFAYRSLYTILGGFVAAKLSANKPERQIMILGILGTIAGAAGVVAGWNLSAHWYPIALCVTGYLFVWIGGKLALKK